MKVLLIQPPIEDFYDTSVRTYPLGLVYVASRVSRVAEVAVLDARTGRQAQAHSRTRVLRDGTFYREGVIPLFVLRPFSVVIGLSAAEIREVIVIARSPMLSA